MKFLKLFFKKNNKRKIAKISLNFMLIFLLLYNNVVYISAQTPTQPAATAAPENTVNNSPENPSATEVPDQSPSPTSASAPQPSPGPFDEPTPSAIPSPTSAPEATLESITQQPTSEPTAGPSLTPLLQSPPQSQNSATIRKPIRSYLISKSHLSPRQSLNVKVFNAQDIDLKIALFREGREVKMDIQKKLIDNVVFLTVNPPIHFSPGKYTLKITDSTNHTEEQSFLWGVLGINSDKSVYLPNEEAKLKFSVLDELGKMVCDAKLTLSVKNESLSINDILSSENGKITVTPKCLEKKTSFEGDYIALYGLGASGVYNLTLTSSTQNGSYTISDSIEVNNYIPFTVDRQEFPTRLNPAEELEVGLNITANQDFSGQIVEAVPDTFNIASSSATPYQWISSAVNSPKGLVTGADSPLIIRYPFEGQYPITLKFSENILDDEEKPLYEKYGLKGHDGIDFALPEGTPIMAVDDGVVALAGRGAYGITVVIQHSWGKSYYGHLEGTGLNVGEKVFKGYKIGLSGKTGLATGPHLHFGMKFTDNDPRNGYYGKIDPWPYLSGSSILPGFSVKLIGWNVSLKKGETKSLKYKFDAPDVSPQFYSLGPLRFYENPAGSQSQTSANPFVLGFSTKINSNPLFAEKRQWQIAVDAPENPPPSPEVAGLAGENIKAEKSVISKGKIIDTNLKENAKAVKRSKGEKIDGVKDEDKLYRWEVELPHGTTFGFGLQDKSDIRPVIKIKNKEGWYLEYEPNLLELPAVKPKVSGNQIEWEIASGITARYTALKDRIKADYIINDKTSLDQIGNRFSFQVRYNDIVVPENLTPSELEAEEVKIAGLLTPELLPDGTIVWLMENGMPAFEHPLPKIIDSNNNEFQGSYDINKNAQGVSYLSIIIPLDQLNSAVFPLTIDPVTVDSAATATGTAYANGRQILRDAWGNLILVCDCGSTDNVWFKNYNDTIWSDSNKDLGVTTGKGISADLDSNGDIHISYIDSASDMHYIFADVSRNAENRISSISIASTPSIDLDTSDLTARPSLIVANKGEGAGKEKVAIAWAMNSTKSTKRGEIRFLQCDVADGCDLAAEWKNASEAKDGNTDGMPSAVGTSGAADVLFQYTAAHTTHHGVLTQVPGRPARTPADVLLFDGATSGYTDLTGANDDNVSNGTGTALDGLTTNDYIYIGDEVKFSRVIVDMIEASVNGASYFSTTNVEYCSGVDVSNDCNAWTDLSNFIDNTMELLGLDAFAENGSILFDEPSSWVLGDVNSSNNKYWIRLQPAAAFDSDVEVGEMEVTDRHSHDLMIAGGRSADNDLGTSYVIWDFIGQAKWENIPGNTTAPAPWRESSNSIHGLGADWTHFTNFTLSTTVDIINNSVYIAYACNASASNDCISGSGSDSERVNYFTNKAALTGSGTNITNNSIVNTANPAVSLTSDQNDIYLFYILLPGTNSLVYRVCDPGGGGTRDICDNSADWGSEKILDSGTDNTHPQAVVSKAYGDTTAFDVVYTTTTAPAVEYERYYVNNSDKTIEITADADDAVHRDCDAGGDDQVNNVVLNVGRTASDSDCTDAGLSSSHIGLRFSNISVIQGQAIASAYLDIREDSLGGGTGAVDFIIYGEDRDSVNNFTNYTNNCPAAGGADSCVNDRTKTSTSTSVALDHVYNTHRIDVTDIVQEIVCRGVGSSQPCVGNFNGSGSWASGNALALLLISIEGGSSSNFLRIDNSSSTFKPTLQINLGNTSKRYSMGVLASPTTSTDLDHPMETEEFDVVNTSAEGKYASVSASLVHSQSTTAVPMFLYKVNNTNNTNQDSLSATAIVKSSIPSKSYGGGHTSGRTVYLQLYHSSNGWETKDSETTVAADTDITLSSGTVQNSTSYFATESPGGSCTGSDCWAAWRVYQDSGVEGNQILYTDYFSASFLTPTPTPASGPTTDQQIRHGAWWNASGIEQPFTF